MEREILFRGKRIDNGEWVKGWYYPQYDDLSIAYILDNVGGFVHEVIPETVSQFTGRYDAQIGGHKVFEDDILLNAAANDLQVVFWNEDKVAWYCRYVDNAERVVSLFESLGNLNKKVGNIHDNPKLII